MEIRYQTTTARTCRTKRINDANKNDGVILCEVLKFVSTNIVIHS